MCGRLQKCLYKGVCPQLSTNMSKANLLYGRAIGGCLFLRLGLVPHGDIHPWDVPSRYSSASAYG